MPSFSGIVRKQESKGSSVYQGLSHTKVCIVPDTSCFMMI